MIQYIDEGSFDVTELKFLLIMKEEYSILKPLALKAKLISKY